MCREGSSPYLPEHNSQAASKQQAESRPRKKPTGKALLIPLSYPYPYQYPFWTTNIFPARATGAPLSKIPSHISLPFPSVHPPVYDVAQQQQNHLHHPGVPHGGHHPPKLGRACWPAVPQGLRTGRIARCRRLRPWRKHPTKCP